MPSPLQGFDQGVAITQNKINDDIYNFFQSTSALANLKVSGKWGKINATMTFASVRLYVPDEPFRIKIFVNLSSGTCEWRNPNSSSTPYTAGIDNWSLVFTVNLSLDEIHKLPSALASKITVPGSYSSLQMLFDFTTARLSTFDPTLSKTPGVDGRDPARASAFRDAMTAYLAQLAENDDNLIGYPITVLPVTNPTLPTFPPVSVQFQTMQNKDAQGNPGHDGLNCFLFLEMTSKASTPPKSITWTQNWVDQNTLNGSMVVSKDNFWDHFRSATASLSNTAFTILNQLAHTLDDESFNSSSMMPWSITDKVPTSTALWSPEANRTKWMFSWSQSDPTEHPGMWEGLRHTYDTEVVVAPDTTGKSITMAAKSHIWRYYGKVMPLIVPVGGVDRSDATVEWKYSFILGSIANGRLAIPFSLIGPKSTVTMSHKSTFGFIGNSDEEASATAQAALKKRVHHTFPFTLPPEVSHEDWLFVFPGGGIFTMTDPKFNSHGDLGVTLTYREDKQDHAAK